MTEEEIATLRAHLTELLSRTISHLAARSTDGITDTGLLGLAADTQTVLLALEAMGKQHNAM